MGVFWCIVALVDYVDRVMVALLFFVLDALQGHARCAPAIVGFAGNISKLILTTMKQIRCKNFYQVFAMVGVVFFYSYNKLVVVFVVYAMMTAYDNILSVSTAVLVYYGVLWLWIPAIYVFCTHTHLLPGYMIAIVSVTAFEAVHQG